MLRKTAIALAVAATAAGLTALPAQAAKHPDGMDVIKAGTMHGQVPARDAHAAAGRHGGSPNMTSHGGAIMQSATVYPIYWGSSWSTNPGDKITGLRSFYGGFGNSNYAKASDEYTGPNGSVGAGVSVNTRDAVDTTAAPSHAPSTSSILAEVGKMYSTPDPSGTGYYPVYTDTPRGGAQYCAWHSYGTFNGKPYIFAFFFKLDGDPGCDPKSTVSGESEGLAALANVSAHELSEARTDPDATSGWFDASGAENGDKCAWTFGSPSVTFKAGSVWKLQGEWSNAAYNANTGYPNSAGQNGCLGG